MQDHDIVVRHRGVGGTRAFLVLLLQIGIAPWMCAGCRSGISKYEPAALPRPGPLASPPSSQEERAQADGTPHPITLEEAIEEALTKGPALRAAAEVVVQSRADLKTASLLPNPQLGLSTTLQPLGTHLTPNNPGGPPQYGIDLSEPLDPILFGKRSAAMASARRAVDVAGADFGDLRRKTRGDVAAAFFDVLEARALLDLARTDLEDLRNVESLTRRRVELGGAPSIDADRARLSAIGAAQDLRAAEATHVGALARLRSLLGRSGVEPGFDILGSLGTATPAEPPPFETALALADEARPDVVSLRRQVLRWDAEALSQRRQGLPTLQAQFGYIYQRQQPVGAPDQNLWEASLSMSVPVFDRNQGNVAKAESQARQARAALEVARAALRAELAQASAAFRAAHAAALSDDPEQLETARSVRDRMEASYKAGGRTLLEVLDAERAYRDANRLHVHIQSGYWRSLHSFNTSVGEPILSAKGATQ